MPSRIDIFDEISQARGGAQDTIRRAYLKQLSDETGRDTVILSSAFSFTLPKNVPGSALSITNEDVQGFMSAFHGLNKDELDLIIHSPGGSLEAAWQIVNYMWSKYDNIRAIIPQNAMSAATMIACACDEIIMGKHSAIGPIDPQITIPTESGSFTAPAQSILDEFERAKDDIKKDPSCAPIWVRRMDKYPIGVLKICDNTKRLSEERVCEWLKTRMFKDDADKQTKGRDIAKWLGETNIHKSHSRPINITEARSRGLVVNPLEDDNTFQDMVLSVFHASMATHRFTACTKFIENQNGKGAFTSFNPK
jgi:ATP-dependent protease ClpP protease subunit